MSHTSFHLGIRAKLLIPILLGFVLVIYVLIAHWTPFFMAHEREDFNRHQRAVLNTLQPSVIQDLISRDYAALFSSLEYELDIHSRDWVFIELYDATGKRLFPLDGEPPDIDEHLLRIAHPLEDNGEYFGRLLLYANWRIEEQEDSEIINQIQLWSIVLFSIITLTSFLWQTIWVLRPIARLQKAAHKLAEGDYESRLPRSSHDELGELTTAFDAMRRNIRTSQKNLQTALQQLKDRENRQRAILETVPDAIISIDENGQIETANPGIETLFGYSAGEIEGHNWATLLADTTAGRRVPKPTELYRNTATQHTELLARHRDGHEFPIELSINPMNIGQRRFFTVVLRDITERKKIDRLKDEFIATVSHELRTPLTAIKGSLGLMQGHFRHELPAHSPSLIEIANRNVDRLLLLINDILEVSKLDASDTAFQCRPLEVMGFIDQAIEINQALALGHDTRFVCVQRLDGAYIMADKHRLMQALSNLLSNAAKYAPANTVVELRVRLEHEQVVIEVSDQGPGVPAHLHDAIFDRFTQADSSNTREVGGTGLGLNIAKKIIERLDGEIGLYKHSGSGASFYIKLPLSEEPCCRVRPGT